MPFHHNKKILAVMEDLLFSVKINEAAKRLGLHTEFVKTEQDALAKAKELPLLIILDLNSHTAQPLKVIERIKQDPELKQLSLISFVSHVQADLKLKAQEAGCDLVMARSAFSTNLPAILKRHAGVP